MKDTVSETDFAFVFASDLLRAIQTAQIAFPNEEIRLDQRLREMNFGDLNGSHGREFPADEMWCIENRFENGEYCLDIEASIRAFLSSSAPRGSKVAWMDPQ